MTGSPAIVGDIAALLAAFKAAWDSRFADAAQDIVALEDVAAVLADLGVPDAALAELVLGMLARAAALKAEFAPGSNAGQYWFYHAGPTVGR